MAPKQKTFELIPTTVGLQGLGQQQQPHHAPMTRPPMTTKQAKTLYRKANKGPKLSKAEQRRIELMEQDRIRKEFEKERNQARARTARERKKAKEDKEKENRKRKGLPLVDVHPSQDTISRFVNRAAGAQGKSKPDATRRDPTVLKATKEEEDDAASATENESAIDVEEGQGGIHAGDHDSDSDDDDDAVNKENREPARESEEREAKRQCLSQNNIQKLPPLARQPPAGPVAKMAQAIASESVSRATSVDIDDPVNQDLLQDQLMADIVLASSRKTASSSPITQSIHIKPDPDPPPVPITKPGVPPLKLQEPVHRKPPARLHPQTVRPQMARPLVSRQDPVRCNNTFRKPAAPYLSAGHPRPPVQSAGPPMPPRFKAPAGPQLYQSTKSKFLPKHLRTPQERPPARQGLSTRTDSLSRNDAPTSTQLFLLEHVDDFFPSPSQEVHELLQDHTWEGKATEPARASHLGRSPVMSIEMVGEKSTLPTAQVFEPTLDFPISTQDFTFSSQDMRDIETPSKPRREFWSRNQAKSATEQHTSLQGVGAGRRQTGAPPSQDVENGCGRSASVSREQSTRDGPSLASSTNNPAIKLPQATSKAIDMKAQTLSPPKKRMFGSSGPGAEVLVAMERSYQQNRREDRAREEERRARERLLTSETNPLAHGTEVTVKADNQDRAEMAASQETDYGDLEIGGDDLAFLEDTTWLEDNLDDCL